MKRAFLPLLVALAAGTAALAHQGVTNPAVMTRMHGMSDIADHMKTLGTMAKGETPFDADAARAAAAGISAHAAEIPALFFAPETDAKSEALPVIWDRFDDFARLSTELKTVADGLSRSISGPDDLQPALRALGGSCRDCHRTYRQ